MNVTLIYKILIGSRRCGIEHRKLFFMVDVTFLKTATWSDIKQNAALLWKIVPFFR